MLRRNLLSRLLLASLLLAAAAVVPRAATAQDTPAAPAAAGTAAVQSTLFFGLKSRDGRGVSEQQWTRFLAEEVTPRFPDGLTVITAYGQGAGPGPDAFLAEMTKVLIIVHPAGVAAAAKIAEIKAKYSRDFDQPGVFHTESDVRIVP